MLHFRAVFFLAILSLWTSSGCAQEQSKREPSECYRVRLTGSAQARLETGMKQLANSQRLKTDSSNPAYFAITSESGQILVLFLPDLQDSGILASYPSRAHTTPPLNALLGLAGHDLSFAKCPATSPDFSPPVLYE